MSPIDLRESPLESTILGNTRRVWCQEPREKEPELVCVFLDAEYYVELLGAPEIVADLQAQERIPTVLAAYVSHVDPATRWPESFCNPNFDRFVVDELLLWLVEEFGLSETIDATIVGLSLTGLSAAHATLASRGRISRVLCQSASFWWRQGWLRRNLASLPASDAMFRISVGKNETIEWVDHGDGLIQEESQLEANRATRDALRARGHGVSYDEFEGGHDLESWRSDLPRSLVALWEM